MATASAYEPAANPAIQFRRCPMRPAHAAPRLPLPCWIPTAQWQAPSRSGKRGRFRALAIKDLLVHRTRGVVVLQGQLPPRIRPRARTGIGYAIGSYDLARHAAAPFGPTRLVRQRLPDERKSTPLGPGFLNSSVSQGQPLPWPRIRCGVVWHASFDPHPGAGDLVTSPAVHVNQNIRTAADG